MEEISTGYPTLDNLVKKWLDWDRNEETRQKIIDLVAEKNVEELKKRLCTRMEFGTAGLRAEMGAGNSMMNDLTVIQTAQGLVQYVLSESPDVKQKGIVLGYDGRHNSQKWAQISAAICINNQIPVYLFSKMCPTPYVAFCIRHFGAKCGVMVTASHNPKQDNGYKVYWENGAQIKEPRDKGISQAIEKNLVPLESSWDRTVVKSSPLCKDPYKEALKAYNEAIKSLSFHSDTNSKSSLQVVYTAMHGVGYVYAKEAFRAFNLLMPIPVDEQVQPDPDFPTVEFPNPQEGKNALRLSILKANATNSPVIVANDPDADRLDVAEKLPNGEWKIFTGNEIGALLGSWLWTNFRKSHPNMPGTDLYMLSSTVSSKILQSMAGMEGFRFEETLTGFKWMGNRADELMRDGKTVLLAFEEAIGFMCGTNVFDKDGISAAAVIIEFATQLYEKNLTLEKQLSQIYDKYGWHLSCDSYFFCHEPAIIKSLFEELRNSGGEGNYPDTCGQYKIVGVRDLTVGYDSTQPDKKPVLPVDKSIQMITFYFENGCVATLRTSGTEPKIKYYTEYRLDPSKGMDKADAERELQDIVQKIIKYFFQPEKFHLDPPPK